MKSLKWILPVAITTILFSSCSSESTTKKKSGPDCSSAPVASIECLDGSWSMDPSRNAQASAVLAEDPTYSGRALPLAIETGDDAITIQFDKSDRSVSATHTLKPELNTIGFFVLEPTGAGCTFKGLWASDPTDATAFSLASVKVVEKPEGYYLILGTGVFSRSPSSQTVEVFYRSLTDE